MAVQLPGNHRIRGSEDDKFEFWAVLTALEDLASSGQVDARVRESLDDAIGKTRELLNSKRIPFLSRRRWLRQLRRKVQQIEKSSMNNQAAQDLDEMLGRIQETAENFRDE
jgi:hypothetical protein